MTRREWTNPPHRAVSIWKLFGLGAVMAVASLGFAETLLRLAA